jgi:hypothetical protein
MCSSALKLDVAAVLAVAIGLGSLCLLGCSKPRPTAIKLGDCTNSSARFHFVCPAGDSFQLALGIAGVTNIGALQLPDYEGTLEITQARIVVFSAVFDSGHNRQLFWLSEREAEAGYMLTLPRRPDQPSLESALKKGIDYELAVSFAHSPPPRSSIWVEWLQ